MIKLFDVGSKWTKYVLKKYLEILKPVNLRQSTNKEKESILTIK